MSIKPTKLEQYDDYWIAQDARGYGNALVLKTSWSSRYLDLIAKRQIKIIRLNDRVGWLDSDISFLTSIPGIHGVDLMSERVTDVSPIFQIEALKTLSLYCKAKVAGDFLRLKRLKNVGLEWRGVYESVFGLRSLMRINILGFPDEDLTCWKHNGHLKELRLESNRLEALSGIERFPKIQQLTLYRCRKLKSLDELAGSASIQVLRISHCPGIDDLSPISRLTELRRLEIEDCHAIHSLAPLAKCKKLQRLQIAGNTTVMDGDFSSLKRLPDLKEVLLAHRKHYSHRAEDLERK